MKTQEANFDGLIGPTHHYAGLSVGNIASVTNQAQPSNPRDAALQGLAKMKLLSDLGIPQAVFPPHERPSLRHLKDWGISGKNEEDVIKNALRQAPHLLSCASSASPMWTANAATVSPSADTADGKVHVTPANLFNKMHRAIEAEFTGRILRRIFPGNDHFNHHPPLQGGLAMGDEGAANHTRLAPCHGASGVHFFVYGFSAFSTSIKGPDRYPARQSLEASSAIARRHQLSPDRVIFAQQNPEAIDAGVFHNDVISVGNENLMFYHEDAFVSGSDSVVDRLAECYYRSCGEPLKLLGVDRRDLSLETVVKSYLFNSQLFTLPEGGMALICPQECQESDQVRRVLEDVTQSGNNPIRKVWYFDLRGSMQNGGGPACLRMRVVLSPAEYSAVLPSIWMDDKLYQRLATWIRKHYRDHLVIEDLADPALLKQTRQALDELTQILNLDSIYPFQTESSLKSKSR